MFEFKARRRGLMWIAGWAALLLTTALPPAARAQEFSVTPTVTFDGGLYHYDYTISNNTGTDFLLVTLGVGTGPDVIQNVAVPDGFLFSYDSGLGLLDFGAGDTQSFAPGTSLSGFAFDSASGPQDSGFTATGLDSEQSAVTVSGETQAPGGAAAIPEPGTLLLALGLVPGLALVRRRKARQA